MHLILKIRIQPDFFPCSSFPAGGRRMRVSFLVYADIRRAQAGFGISLYVQKDPVVLPLCMAIEECDFSPRQPVRPAIYSLSLHRRKRL